MDSLNFSDNFSNNIWKMIRKIQSIHLYYFHAWSNKLTWCFNQNKEKHFKRPCLSLKFESLTQIGSNPSGFSCISTKHNILPCHIHASYCALHWLCFSSVAGDCPLSIDGIPTMWSLTLMKTQCYLRKCQASKTPLFIPIQSHSLAPALFYCIRTTPIHLLLVAVAEPLYPLHDLSLPQ